jgi:hypothetical protein
VCEAVFVFELDDLFRRQIRAGKSDRMFAAGA